MPVIRVFMVAVFAQTVLTQELITRLERRKERRHVTRLLPAIRHSLRVTLIFVVVFVQQVLPPPRLKPPRHRWLVLAQTFRVVLPRIDRIILSIRFNTLSKHHPDHTEINLNVKRQERQSLSTRQRKARERV